MNSIPRREFFKNSALVAGAFLTAGLSEHSNIYGAVDPKTKPAILGGSPIPVVPSPNWPILHGNEIEALQAVLESRNWCRAGNPACVTNEFETAYANLLGAKHCVAVNSGTSSLIASLAAFDVGPGDEVITTPYTFVATVNCIIQHYGLPVFADVDLETFQLDPRSAEKLISPNTKVLLPVHIGGAPADMDAFIDMSKQQGNLPIVEDACQAHLGKWGEKYLGTLGNTGCFSMQVTKNIACGDGGAILTNDDRLADRLAKIHSNGRSSSTDSFDFKYAPLHAANYRLTGFQSAILLTQLPYVQGYAETRNANALYLSSLLTDIPGVYPQRIYDGATSAWHLYMFRIVPEEFGCSREQVASALEAEGINVSTGYGTGDWVSYVKSIYSTGAARRVYSEKALDDWAQRTQLPMLNTLCSQALWFEQADMLAPRTNMDTIADALRRIQKYAGEIAEL